MFTFGREKEKRHALSYANSPKDALLIKRLIDAVHDLIEGSMPSESIAPVLAGIFAEGGRGVWEQTGSWLRKLSSRWSEMAELWPQLAKHKSAKVRFRVAAFLNDMPEEMRKELIPILLSDESAKVRSKTAGEIFMKPHQGILPTILDHLATESDPTVRSALEDARQACETCKS